MRARKRTLVVLAATVGVLALVAPRGAEARSGAPHGAGTSTQFACNPWLEFCSCDRGEKNDCKYMKDLVCKADTVECNSSICWCDLKKKRNAVRDKPSASGARGRTIAR